MEAQGMKKIKEERRENKMRKYRLLTIFCSLLSILIVFLLFTKTGDAAQDNLLKNPDFERSDTDTQISDWYLYLGPANVYNSSPLEWEIASSGSWDQLYNIPLSKDDGKGIWSYDGVDHGPNPWSINRPEEKNNFGTAAIHKYSTGYQELFIEYNGTDSKDPGKNIYIIGAQTVQVKPNTRYRFGMEYQTPGHTPLGEQIKAEVWFYSGKTLEGTKDSSNGETTNSDNRDWKQLFTEYRTDANTTELTASLRLYFPGKTLLEEKGVEPTWIPYNPGDNLKGNSWGSIKGVWMQEVDDDGGGGGSGGGSGGGGGSGVPKPVTVQYYKDGDYQSSSDEKLTGYLGSSSTVPTKNFGTDYEFEKAVIGSRTVTTLPVKVEFTTSPQTVKMYYKKKVTDTYTFEVGNYDLGNKPVTMIKPTDSELKSWFASKSRVLKNGAIADNNIGASEISVAWVDTWAPSVGNKSYRVRVTYTSPTYNQQVVGQSVVANLNVNFQAAPTHNYNIRSDATINYGSVEVGSGAPAGSFYNDKVYLYDGNTKVKPLTESSDFTVLNYSPVWTSQNTTAGSKTYTVTFRTTAALDGQYEGLSSNDTTTSTLTVTFTPKPWELKVTPVPQTYKTTDSPPTAAQRLGWVQAEIVSTANPPQPSLDASVNSVTITAKESAPGSGSYIPASTVDMDSLGTTKYRVTVSATGMDGNTYSQNNVEVPITIEPGIIAELKVKVTNPQTAWTTDEPLIASASWVQAVITENDEEKQAVENPTVKITGREAMPNSGTYTETDGVDMLSVGITNYRVEVSAEYNGVTLTGEGIVSVTIKKLELKADPVGTQEEPIVIDRNGEVSNETLRTWVKNVRLEGKLTENAAETIVALQDNDSYEYTVSFKEGETVDTGKIGEQTCTLVVTATTTINGAQTFGPIEVPVTIWITGLGLEVPEELDFKNGRPSVYQKQLLERSDTNWTIGVVDTRKQAQTDWTVNVKLTQNFQTEIGSDIREIKDILFYKDQSSAEGHFIDGDNYPIFTGKGDVTKSWASDAGFLLSITPWKSLNIQKGNYTAVLAFTLSDAP